jgi:DNA-binding ferritin-like protein
MTPRETLQSIIEFADDPARQRSRKLLNASEYTAAALYPTPAGAIAGYTLAGKKGRIPGAIVAGVAGVMARRKLAGKVDELHQADKDIRSQVVGAIPAYAGLAALPIAVAAHKPLMKAAKSAGEGFRSAVSKAKFSMRKPGKFKVISDPVPASAQRARAPEPLKRLMSAREELDSIISLDIHIKKENRGKLTATEKKTGKSKSELADSKNPVTRKRAQFALNAAKWDHSKGGGKKELSARGTLRSIVQLDEETSERSSLEGLAISYRRMQLFAHNAHNLATGKTFMQDHGFLSELYAAYTDAYDDLVERMIGLGQSADLSSIQQQAAASIPSGSPFPTLLGMEKAVTAEIEEEIKEGGTQGTINLLAGLADASEVRQYKLGQILKGSAVKLSAREELEVIRFGFEDKFNAMRKAAAQRGLATDIMQQQANPAMFHLFPHGSNVRTAKMNALTGDYKIHTKEARDRLLRKRGGASSMNSAQLSARDQLNTILMGVDPRPRNPLGEFSGAEEGQPNPQHMKITYGSLAAGAAGGAAFQGGGMALKALVEKLKKAKK